MSEIDYKARFGCSSWTWLFLLFILTMSQNASGAGRISVFPVRTISQFPSRDVQFSFSDSEGFLWYGFDGYLSRDDGYNIVTFPLDGVERVNRISETLGGNILVATDNGCFMLDKKVYKVVPFDSQKFGNTNVNYVGSTSDGSIWIGKKGVLSRYNSAGKWVRDYPVTDRRGAPTYVSGFTQGRNGDILMTSYSRGVYGYNKRSDSFELRNPIEKDVSLGIIFQDFTNDYYWVSDHDGMIYRYDPRSKGESVFIESLPAEGGKIGRSRRVREMVQDNVFGYLWVFTRSSLAVLQPDSEGHLHYLDLPAAAEYDGTMITSMSTRPGELWVFCYDHPSSVITFEPNSNGNNRLQSLHTKYGDNPIITELCQDSDEDWYWIVQLRSGLILYNNKTGEIYDHDRQDLRKHRLYQAEKLAKSDFYGGVWVSQAGSVVTYCVGHDDNMRINVVDSVSLKDVVPEKSRVTRLLEDQKSRLWIGTTAGLFRYDFAKGGIDAAYRNLKSVRGMVRVGKTLWAISKDGLFAVEEGKKPRVSAIKCSLTAVAASPDGKIWVGSKNGDLYSYNPKNDTFVDYSSDYSHERNEIKQLHVDKFGHIWIVSDIVVSQFNPRNKTHKDYESGNKGQLSAYLSTSNMITPNDDIVVGGVGGVALFTPSNALDIILEEPEVKISDIKVNGKSILDDYQKYVRNGKLQLRSDAVNIEIFFSTLDLANASNERFAYRIKGVDKDWNYTKRGENRAFYNSLPKGEYILEFKACDENNYWNQEPSALVIYRAPAFYATWWAIAIYVLLALLILGYILHLYLKHINKENEEMWSDSKEMVKMRTYLSSPVTLPEEEFRELDRILLEKATKVVEKNIAVPDFGVSDLASDVNMSKSSLARKLKAITGKTPLDFIRQIKMQYACRLLESQNHTVAEVAEMVGFEDRRYFTTSFKKEVGVTPSGYLKGERPEKGEYADKENDSEETEPDKRVEK